MDPRIGEYRGQGGGGCVVSEGKSPALQRGEAEADQHQQRIVPCSKFGYWDIAFSAPDSSPITSPQFTQIFLSYLPVILADATGLSPHFPLRPRPIRPSQDERPGKGGRRRNQERLRTSPAFPSSTCLPSPSPLPPLPPTPRLEYQNRGKDRA